MKDKVAHFQGQHKVTSVWSAILNYTAYVDIITTK